MSFDFGPMNAAVAGAFAEAVVWLDAPWRAAPGIFDSRHFAAAPGAEAGVSILETTLSIDLAELAEGDAIGDDERVEARGIAYRIVDRRPGGEGWLVLVLERAED